jgi:hypothetical protein
MDNQKKFGWKDFSTGLRIFTVAMAVGELVSIALFVVFIKNPQYQIFSSLFSAYGTPSNFLVLVKKRLYKMGEASRIRRYNSSATPQGNYDTGSSSCYCYNHFRRSF